MAVALSGMTLHTNNDNEANWSGTDGPDTYNNSVQGTNSESWQVSKNASETGTLTVSSALNTTRGLFTFWMASNLAPYYTDIRLELQSTASNYKQFTVAAAADKNIDGVFVPSNPSLSICSVVSGAANSRLQLLDTIESGGSDSFITFV